MKEKSKIHLCTRAKEAILSMLLHIIAAAAKVDGKIGGVYVTSNGVNLC